MVILFANYSKLLIIKELYCRYFFTSAVWFVVDQLNGIVFIAEQDVVNILYKKITLLMNAVERFQVLTHKDERQN